MPFERFKSSAERARSVRRPLLRFTLAGIVALLVLGVGSVWASRRAGTTEAIRDARAQTTILGLNVLQPALRDELEDLDPEAIAALDVVVRNGILGDELQRVKIWGLADPEQRFGTILYSNEPALIGQRHALEEDEHEAFWGTATSAEVSDLDRPENQFEREFGKLLEVYLPLSMPNGDPVLFEAYYKYDAVVRQSRDIWLLFGPVTVLALLALELVQVPLAWSMARELQERQREREGLLQRAIDSSDAERRRIARDLHDGVVQELTALSFDLAAVAEDQSGEQDQNTETIRQAAQGTRRAIRSLRSLLVDIYPPNLHEQGISVAIADLLEAARSRGVSPHIQIGNDVPVDAEDERLIFRVVQEALRNVLAHAEASNVTVSLEHDGSALVLEVVDDGRGFDPTEVGQEALGHVGLRLLRDLASERGGRLAITSVPGQGTTVRLEVPR